MATPNYKSFALLFQKLSSKMEYKSKNLEKSKPLPCLHSFSCWL